MIVIGGANSVSDAVVEEVKNAKKPPVVTPPLPVVPDPVDPKPVVPTPPTPSLPSDSAACYATGLPKGGLKDSPYPDRLIKGNINSKSERIYHMVGMRDYNKTWIDECVGEKWFATEAEAKAAGWRKAQQ